MKTEAEIKRLLYTLGLLSLDSVRAWGVTADAAWASVERARGRPVPDTSEQRVQLAPFEYRERGAA